MSRVYDFVVHGATGFTGRHVARQLARRVSEESRSANCALAGRNIKSLEALQSEIQRDFSVSFGVVIADSGNQTSIDEMAAQARVILACVGPYRLYGEPLIEACAKHGTHYVDITGEPGFMDQMAHRHFATAQTNGATIVHSTGFDSLIAELGLLHATRTALARGLDPLVSESVLLGKATKGMVLNYGTWHSLVYSLSSIKQLRAQRLELRSQRATMLAASGDQDAAREDSDRKELIKQLKPRRRKHKGATYHRDFKAYVAPFPGSDVAVVRNSHILRRGLLGSAFPLHEPLPEYAEFFRIGGRWTVFKMGIGLAVWSFLAKRAWGRNLLLKYPRFFTGGLFSHAGPTEEQIAATSIEMRFNTMCAKDGKVTSSKDDVETSVTGPDPGYRATSQMMVECALTIADNMDALPRGVLTPSAAFYDTNLIDRLGNHTDVCFSVMSPSSSS